MIAQVETNKQSIKIIQKKQTVIMFLFVFFYENNKNY